VVYGRGIELMNQKDNEIASSVDELRKKGVQFLVCNNTLRNMDIDYRTLHNVAESDVVPSGFLEVAWLQQQGYHVDPTN
jgi:intracellular sulfur oxidation DsrE/DsrF family protein